MPPEKPHRGPIREQNVATSPHTPIPPASDTVSTAPPPAPDRRDPPRQYQVARPVPREDTLVSSPPPVPMRPKLDSVEISHQTLLHDWAARGEEIRAEEAARRAAQAEADELRRQLRDLDRSNHLPHVEVAPRGSLPPKRTDWAKGFFGLMGALTLFLGGLGTYLGARAATREQHVDVVEQKQAAQQVVVDPLPAKVVSVERGESSCKAWARATDDYNRQVWGKLGVVIPPQPNSPPVTPIKSHAIVRRANALTGAPLLEIETPPPPLP